MPREKVKKIVAVAMSGGVDSSVTAFLLQKEGYETLGFYMRLSNKNKEAENSARRVCAKLGMKFYPVNIALDFKREVIKYFLDTYKSGQTPNPCVRCNQMIKFGRLLDISKDLGADFLATGHYIKKTEINSSSSKQKSSIYKLYKGKYKTKDQSYFLYTLTQAKLKHILFPLGKYKKEKVREIANQEKLPYLTGESQDICFLEGDHNDYLKQHLNLKSGPIKILKTGEQIGEHKGLPLYTIGQRKGIEIGGTGPYYAVRFDYKNNILFVSDNQNDKELYTSEIEINRENWVGEKPKLPYKCEAVFRYHQPVVEVVVQEKNKKVVVKFKEAQRAVTSGQSIVFYQGDEVIGGGVVEK